MADDAQPKSSPETATGGCAIACGSIFLITGVAFLFLSLATRHFKPDTLMILLFVAGPSLTLGHVLAIVAIQSKSLEAQERGKRALWLMWIGLVVVAVLYAFFHPSPK